MHSASRTHWIWILCGLLLAGTALHCNRRIPYDIVNAPVRTTAYWARGGLYPIDKSLPLEQRIHSAPESIVTFAREINKATGYPQIPEAFTPDSAFAADLRSALASIPPPAARAVGAHLLAIYPMRNLGSSGIAESVVDSSGTPVAGFFLLDVDLLNKRANDWCTWRENTPFRPQSPWTLRCRIEAPDCDNRIGALRFLLLHELAHIASIGTPAHPDWSLPDSAIRSLSPFTFAPISWSADSAGLHRKERTEPLAHKDLRYYSSKPSLPLEQSPDFYRALETSDFVSLYGALTVYEDFAETFLHYVHGELLGKPFSIEIHNGDSLVEAYHIDWSHPRLAAKKAWIQGFLE